MTEAKLYLRCNGSTDGSKEQAEQLLQLLLSTHMHFVPMGVPCRCYALISYGYFLHKVTKLQLAFEACDVVCRQPGSFEMHMHIKSYSKGGVTISCLGPTSKSHALAHLYLCCSR